MSNVSVQNYIEATPSNQKPGQLHPYSLQTCSAAHTAPDLQAMFDKAPLFILNIHTRKLLLKLPLINS